MVWLLELCAGMDVIQDHIRTLFDHELHSLCMTCNHRATCVYRQQSSKVIVQCELFSIPGAVAIPAAAQAEVPARKALGLCDTCVHKRTCSYFARNGYVWHCEEFA